MTARAIGKSDGRWKMAIRAVRNILALDLDQNDKARLMKFTARVVKRHERESAANDQQPDRSDRQCLGQWAIRLMLKIGFNASQIAGQIGVSHTTITRAINPTEPRVLSAEKIVRLLDAVNGAGAERLNGLLPPDAIQVLDTCSDAGHTLDGPTRTKIARGAHSNLINALVFSSAPVPMVPGVYASLSQIGDPVHGLYLIQLPPESSEDPAAHLRHWRLREHEVRHLYDRVRAKRKKAEEALRRKRKSPKDGSIA